MPAAISKFIMRPVSNILPVVFTTFITLFILAVPAGAWSTKEHMLLTRLAAGRLLADAQTPPAMKAWLLRNIPNASDDLETVRQWFLTQHVGRFARGSNGLTYWAALPDLVSRVDRRNIDPLGAPESKMHYIDVELFNPDAARRTYAPDLSNAPSLADFPTDLKDPRYMQSGFLPFRLAQSYHRLVAAIHAGRLEDRPGQYPHDEHAVHWAGYLAHYIEDNTQPQHATLDHRSQSYFANDPHAPNLHGVMEVLMVDADNQDYMALREEYWPLLMAAIDQAKDVATTDDPWKSTIQTALYSYRALPLIGQAGVAAAAKAQADHQPAGTIDAPTFFHFEGTVEGQSMTVMQMKARQQALAVIRVQKFWLKAWLQGTAGATSMPMP